MRQSRGSARAGVLAAAASVAVLSAQVEFRVRPVTYDDVRAIVQRLADALPARLAGIPEAQRATAWTAWVKERDAEVRSRILQGEQDSLVNLLLFGTSFTEQPRVTAAFLQALDRQWQVGERQTAEQALGRAYTQRASDLVTAASRPERDARMEFARTVLERAGQTLDTPEGRTKAGQYLLADVVRVREEAAGIARELEAARSQADSTRAFAERSRLFRNRGLASDSSVLTQFAVDRALQALRESGLLRPGGVTRIAIVGPGLDFVDKQEGLDFYPPQSLQPFAVLDSLARLELARPDSVRLVTLDINPRVNRHLDDARDRSAQKDAPYRLVLPRVEHDAWSREAIDYWTRLGSRLGTSVSVRTPAGVRGVLARGIDVRPDVVGRLTAVDANIVYDRLEIQPTDRFDLAIATNVLLYYDTFEQTLALSNIAALLRPGGLLLSNNAVLEIPEVPMTSGGYLTVRFSARDDDGEHMVWYVRQP